MNSVQEIERVLLLRIRHSVDIAITNDVSFGRILYFYQN